MATKRRAKTIGVLEFTRLFPDEDAAVAHFEGVRWGGIPTCPSCGQADSVTECKRRYFRWCGHCREYFTAKKGTVMESSKVPVRTWLLAMYYLVTARKGISSIQLSKELSVSQPTAWFLLHRLREACGSNLEVLSDVVEIDETYIGGKEKNKHQRQKTTKRRGTAGKQAVFGMRERGGPTVAWPVPATDRTTLVPAIEQAVKPGSIVFTDDSGTYRELGLAGYYHQAVNHSAKQYVLGPAHTNSMESVWAVLKRGHYGTYHKMSTKHLHRYVNEFTFRLNAGDVQHDTLDRMASLSQALCGKRVTYRELTA
ncbi:MAG: IS1595 family transposase [Nitrospira sp.]|nr:IS1595 family transposase [Nitrospira sp.]